MKVMLPDLILDATKSTPVQFCIGMTESVLDGRKGKLGVFLPVDGF